MPEVVADPVAERALREVQPQRPDLRRPEARLEEDPRVARANRTSRSIGRSGTRSRSSSPPAISCGVRDRSADLLQAENWDLVVLDEAHHARRKSPGSSPGRWPEPAPSPDAGAPTQVPIAPAAHGHADAGPSRSSSGTCSGCLASPDDGRRAATTSSGTSPRRLGNPSQEMMEYLAGMFRETESYLR